MHGIPDGIDDLSVPFAVDELLGRLAEPRRRIRLQTRWQSHSALAMKSLIRHAVVVEIMRGTEVDELQEYGKYAEDWQNLAAAGDRAFGANLEFLKHLSGLGSKGLARDGEKYLVAPLFSFHNHSGANANAVTSLSLSKADAKALLHVNNLLQKFGAYAAERAKMLTQDRPNPGRPGKVRFTLTLAEMWVAITGRLPGKQPENNLFLWFASSAWKDAGEATDEDFTHSMREAISQLSARFKNGSVRDFVPDWLEG